MILSTIFRILYMLLWLFDVALLIYVLLSWLNIGANKFTEALRKVVEPVLAPIRRLLCAKLPPRWQILDWSPVAAWLCVEIVRYLLQVLQGILM